MAYASFRFSFTVGIAFRMFLFSFVVLVCGKENHRIRLTVRMICNLFAQTHGGHKGSSTRTWTKTAILCLCSPCVCTLFYVTNEKGFYCVRGFSHRSGNNGRGVLYVGKGRLRHARMQQRSLVEGKLMCIFFLSFCRTVVRAVILELDVWSWSSIHCWPYWRRYCAK